MTTDPKHPITVCLGSSCFARGNSQNLPLIQEYLQTHGLEEQVELRGSRCEGHCLKGPNLRIGEQLVGEVHGETLMATLSALLS